MSTPYYATNIAVLVIALSHVSTGLVFLCSRFQPEYTAVTFLVTMEKLLTFTTYIMVIPVVEMHMRSSMALKVHEMDTNNSFQKSGAMLVAKNTINTTANETGGDYAMKDVAIMMKETLKLEIERLEAMKILREATASATPSLSNDTQTVSASPSVSNEIQSEIKPYDESASSHSAAQTVV